MKKLLFKNIDRIYTFDNRDTRLKEADIYVEDGVIRKIGDCTDSLGPDGEVIDCKGLIALPGSSILIITSIRPSFVVSMKFRRSLFFPG